jgi:YgiT-type zinc finger domain-containing protein
MKCVLCKQGEAYTGKVTVTLQRGDTLVIIKQVPAHAITGW